MKECPECHELFDDGQNFCDLDGTPLLDESTLLRAALQRAAVDLEPSPQSDFSSSRGIWLAIPLGIMIGVVLCLFVYLVLLAPMQNKKPLSVERSASTKPQLAPVSSTQAVSRIDAQGTPSPQAEPSAATESEQATNAETSESAETKSDALTTKSVQPSLNDGPISTGGRETRERARAIITLKDGVIVEADAAWEDRQGIWYRRGGLVSFIERSRVEAITEPKQSKPSSSDSTTP